MTSEIPMKNVSDQVLELPKKQFALLMLGDVRACLRRLPAESVDTVVTSPPYWGLRNYGIPPVVWDGNAVCDHEWGERLLTTKKGNPGAPSASLTSGGQYQAEGTPGTLNNGNFCERCGAWKGQLGLEPTFHLYVKHIVDVIHEVRRVLKPTGSLFLNLGDTYNSAAAGKAPGVRAGKAQIPHDTDRQLQEKTLIGIPFRVYLAMLDDGWIGRNIIPWIKPNHMPSSVRDRFSNSWEPVFFFVKSRRYWFDLDAVREPHLTNEGRPGGIVRTRELEYQTKFEGLMGIPGGNGDHSDETVLDDAFVERSSASQDGDVDLSTEEERKKPERLDSEQGQRWERGKNEWNERFSPGGKNPGDILETSVADAVLKRSSLGLYGPHSVGNAAGKNPGDIFEAPTAKRGWASSQDICFKRGYDHHIPALHKKRALGPPVDYFRIQTQPFMEAHFAVFPESLVRRPIMATAPKEICLKCGKARERVSKTEYDVRVDHPKAEEPKLALNMDNKFKSMQFTGSAIHYTTGWKSCSCSAGFRSGIVLDPFGGSGTVAKVALENGLSTVYIDVKESYREMAKRRIDFGHPTLDNSVEWLEVKVDGNTVGDAP